MTVTVTTRRPQGSSSTFTMISSSPEVSSSSDLKADLKAQVETMDPVPTANRSSSMPSLSEAGAHSDNNTPPPYEEPSRNDNGNDSHPGSGDITSSYFMNDRWPLIFRSNPTNNSSSGRNMGRKCNFSPLHLAILVLGIISAVLAVLRLPNVAPQPAAQARIRDEWDNEVHAHEALRTASGSENGDKEQEDKRDVHDEGHGENVDGGERGRRRTKVEAYGIGGKSDTIIVSLGGKVERRIDPADEMAIRRRNSIVPGIAVVTPDFIENCSLDEEVDHSPYLTSILTAAAQTERAKLHDKIKRPERMVQVVTRQLLYQFSNNCLAFQAESGLFLWSTGCARQIIDALYRCGLSVAYDSVLNLVESLGEHCNTNAVRVVATDPAGVGYDNINISTSIFVEQRGAAGPAKVTSGTFAVLYGLHRLFAYNEGFERVAKEPSLKPRTIRAIPVGWKTPQIPTRASTTEEATTGGNLLFHDERYIDKLRRTPKLMSKYAIPSFHDQLTNSRIRSAQVLHSKDVNAWERREIFQLGFGLFHLCLNLAWAVLHTHCGSVNELGSLTYFFTLMEKTGLGNNQPDYHSLLAALTQVVDGLLLNAWLRECGFSSFKLFAESNPSPETLRNIASRIVNDYSTPMNTSSHTPEESSSDSESEESESSSEAGNCSTPKASTPQSTDPEDDPAHHNIRLLARDLLMVAVLVRAISIILSGFLQGSITGLKYCPTTYPDAFHRCSH
ncbi:hypothetical protein B0H13DRAFT_1861663 [Mycena leptocephala]|nr:hypothetical protein B0H13DRAFT_1861663 [Mycena leptocephala]